MNNNLIEITFITSSFRFLKRMACLLRYQRLCNVSTIRYCSRSGIRSNYHMLKDQIPATSLAQKRITRKITTISSITEKTFHDNDFRLVYEGPLSKKIKFLKMFSLTTATVSLAAPVVIFMSHSTLHVVAKALLASTVIVMGVTTTSLLHWLTRVYVYKMFFHPDNRTFAAETSTIFGTTKRQYFSVEDMVIPEVESAFSTFEAKGSKYFIHVDLKEAEQILKYVRDYNLESL